MTKAEALERAYAVRDQRCEYNNSGAVADLLLAVDAEACIEERKLAASEKCPRCHLGYPVVKEKTFGHYVHKLGTIHGRCEAQSDHRRIEQLQKEMKEHHATNS